MLIEDGEAAEPTWGRQIEAVASRRDCAAFVALFDHFAPRVKTLMLRSGVSDATAEEIAQQTMLIVWRKADLFSRQCRRNRLDIHYRAQSPDRRAPTRTVQRFQARHWQGSTFRALRR